MTLPTTDTIVRYPDGALTSTGTVLHREDLGDGRAAVVLDETAFHPVDTAWPDQPADRGTLARDGDSSPAGRVTIEDAIVAATDGSSLFVGRDVPVKKGTEGWAFLVAHLVSAEAAVSEGDRVIVEADGEYRRSLSTGHTACHLASLGLNRVLAGAWRKEVMTDAAGSPNFDALAIESSTIVPDGSVDVYRIGKSLRKRGFDPESLADTAVLADGVNALLADWVASAAPASVEHSDDLLTGRRAWVAELPEGRVEIPCGGTHVGSLDAFSSLSVSFEKSEVEGASVLTMTTTAVSATGR